MTHVKVFFDQIHSVIAKHLTEARASVQVATAWIGDDELIERLAEKARQGVAVDLIVSADSFNEASESKLDLLQEAGANVLVWGQRRDRHDEYNTTYNAPLMHHKFCVIDGRTLINGSLNWTYKARSNRENIVITNDAEAARRFEDQFWLLRRESRNWFSGLAEPFNATFTATHYRVTEGAEVQLDWEVNGASEVMLEGKPVVDTGFARFRVNSTTTFRLDMEVPGRATARALTIEVISKPVVRFTVSQDSIVKGDQVTLRWSVSHADKLRLLPLNIELNAEGSMVLSPDKHTTYSLEATNEAGVSTRTGQVRVFAVPAIASIHIPLPVELRTSLSLEFQEFTAPATLWPGKIGKGISLRFPSIRSIKASLTGKEPVAMPSTPKKRLQDAFDDLKNSIRGINFGNL